MTTPFILADYSVLTWVLFPRYMGLRKTFNADIARVIAKLLWAELLNSGSDILDLEGKPFRLAIAVDTKNANGGYWRSELFARDQNIQVLLAATNRATNYKGSRKKKLEEFKELYAIGLEYARQYFTVFEAPNFEADDMFGLFYRVAKATNCPRQKYFWSVDRDLTQLVDDDLKIAFLNTRKPKPSEQIQNRLVDAAGVAEHTLWKYSEPIDHPSELLEVKVQYGDAGDNVPAGEFSRVYMDLFNPCPVEEYNLDNQFPRLVELAHKELQGAANSRHDHLVEARLLLQQQGVK